MELTTAPLVTREPDLTGQLGCPTITVDDELAIPAGEADWVTWCTAAERVPLVRVLGVLGVRQHRTR